MFFINFLRFCVYVSLVTSSRLPQAFFFRKNDVPRWIWIGFKYIFIDVLRFHRCSSEMQKTIQAPTRPSGECRKAAERPSAGQAKLSTPTKRRMQENDQAPAHSSGEWRKAGGTPLVEPPLWNSPCGTPLVELPLLNPPWTTLVEIPLWNPPCGTPLVEPSLWSRPCGPSLVKPPLWNFPCV